MNNEDFEELKESVREGGKMLSKSQKRRITLQKEGQKVSDDRLKELMNEGWLSAEVIFALKELQSLRKELMEQTKEK